VARRKGGRLSAVQPQRERGGVSTHEEREERRVAGSQKYNRRPQRGREEREEREEEREGVRVARRKVAGSLQYNRRENGGVSTHEEREERRVAGSQKYNRREDERSARNVRRSARGMGVARRKGGRLSAVQPQRERGEYRPMRSARSGGWHALRSITADRKEDERSARNVRRSARGVRVARRKGGRLSAVQPQRERGEYRPMRSARSGGWQALRSITAERTRGARGT